MKKKWSVGILLFDDVEVLDFAGPFEVFSVTTYPKQQVDTLESKPFLVKLVSETGNLVRACNGLEVKPDYSFDNAPHFDILVVPGGFGVRMKEIYNEKIIQWISHRMKNVELMTSVCTGALLLAKAGLLNGKMATTHWASYDRLENEFPAVIVKRKVKFVDAGNIVTSGGISAGINMAFHIVKRLLGLEIAQTTAKMMEYDITIK
ncbi:DJ-1/PfpI family protein [Bacillus thuringiensis]|uniref:DJ-1/PfpI family protein n=1 Tax=Bacillus thuringiensis TaxID=1428 RepID=UPI000BFD74C5|nr:DJ-1/PfpI family protein [Bacillus thuringiensis]PGW37198.1 AraC family transcriptional regulator [Bacillus thuringiensis]